MSENLLDYIGYHEKWHGEVQKNRKSYRYNQNDYLIMEIFNRIGIEKGTFLEFGAIDGIKGSNTRLLHESGWNSGILIECNENHYKELSHNYKNELGIHTFCTIVDDNTNKIDSIIDKTDIEKINFCSIDIDGLDLDIFMTMEKYLPDVVCIEGGQCLDPFERVIPRELSKNNIQQSLQTYCKEFEKKGYKLIASYQDNIFVKEEYFDLFDVKDKDLLDFYLEGILAYPRIPWLIQQCLIYKIQNRFLSFLVADMNIEEIFAISQSDSKTKSTWVDNNYQTLQNRCRLIIKNKENIL